MKSLKLILNLIFISIFIHNNCYASLQDGYDYYLGVKIVCAEMCPTSTRDGYRVKYSDNYMNWIDEDNFRRMYFMLGNNYDNYLIPYSIYNNLMDRVYTIDSKYKITSNISLPGGKIVSIDGYNGKVQLLEETKREIISWIKFAIAWGANGISVDKNISKIKCDTNNGMSYYYLGAKIVRAERADIGNAQGYTVLYMNGDNGWVDKKIFDSKYINIGKEIDDISNETLNFFLRKRNTEVLNGNIKSWVELPIGYSLELDKNFGSAKDIEDELTQNVYRSLLFILQLAKNGTEDTPPFNANLNFENTND